MLLCRANWILLHTQIGKYLNCGYTYFSRWSMHEKVLSAEIFIIEGEWKRGGEESHIGNNTFSEINFFLFRKLENAIIKIILYFVRTERILITWKNYLYSRIILINRSARFVSSALGTFELIIQRPGDREDTNTENRDECRSSTRYVNMKPEFLYRKYTFMKMIKNTLFEVLSIASYTFFPPVWQLVDATPRKLSLFWGKPVVEAFSYIFVKSEALVRKCVSHRCK